MQLCFLYHGEHCSKKVSKIPLVATNVNDSKESLTNPILKAHDLLIHVYGF